ncbi:hypothetical protein V490_04101 [Pseudogymnoascus sp. VKM F-3557]|nr:hypothetical protein V490_04101 [Pseudogymnoascus sp. VKM F-3557]
MMKALLITVTLSYFGLVSAVGGTKRAVAFTPNTGSTCELVCEICPSYCKQTQEGCVDKKTNKFCGASAGGYNSCNINGPCGYGSRGCLDDETGMYDNLSPGTHAGHCPSAEQVDEWRKEDDKQQEEWRRLEARKQCFGCRIDNKSDCKSNQGLFKEEVQCFKRNCEHDCAYYLTFACEECRDEIVEDCEAFQPDPKLRPQCEEEECRPDCDEKLFWIEAAKAH